MNKRNIFVVVEYIWIVMAAFCLGMGIYYQIEIGTGKVWLFYGLAVVSAGMFAVRRQQRINADRKNKRRK